MEPYFLGGKKVHGIRSVHLLEEMNAHELGYVFSLRKVTFSPGFFYRMKYYLVMWVLYMINHYIRIPDPSKNNQVWKVRGFFFVALLLLTLLYID